MMPTVGEAVWFHSLFHGPQYARIRRVYDEDTVDLLVSGPSYDYDEFRVVRGDGQNQWSRKGVL